MTVVGGEQGSLTFWKCCLYWQQLRTNKSIISLATKWSIRPTWKTLKLATYRIPTLTRCSHTLLVVIPICVIFFVFGVLFWKVFSPYCCLVSPPVFVFSRLFDCVPRTHSFNLCVSTSCPCVFAFPLQLCHVNGICFSVYVCLFLPVFSVLSLTRGVALIVMVSAHVYNLFILPLDLLLVFPCVILFFCLSYVLRLPCDFLCLPVFMKCFKAHLYLY